MAKVKIEDHADLNWETKNRDTLEYVKTQGDVEPEGTECKKSKSDMNMNQGNAANRKQSTDQDPYGTADFAKKGKGKVGGDRFKASTEVEPSGTNAGKGK